MLEKEAFYWLLASLGADNKLAYYELRLIANTLAKHRRHRPASDKELQRCLKKLLTYGLLKLDKRSMRPFKMTLPCSKWMITSRGQEALDAYKKMRYYGTKEEYKLGDGEENITNPGLDLNERDPRLYYDKAEGRWKAKKELFN